MNLVELVSASEATVVDRAGLGHLPPSGESRMGQLAGHRQRAVDLADR